MRRPRCIHAAALTRQRGSDADRTALRYAAVDEGYTLSSRFRARGALLVAVVAEKIIKHLVRKDALGIKHGPAWEMGDWVRGMGRRVRGVGCVARLAGSFKL